MSVRRMHPVTGPARVAGLVTAGSMAGVGVLHAAWALRVTAWPGTDERDLTDRVVGRQPFPSDAATWTVVGLCGAAALSLGVRAGSPTGAAGRCSHLAARVVAGVMALRAAAGFVVSGGRLIETSATFRRNDLRIYSPLCAALAFGAWLGSGGRHRR
jgi:hypothetical protein